MSAEDPENYIDQATLVETAKRLPPEDFANRQFDRATGAATTDILFLFSTPRCGSTLLADLVQSTGWCLAHEYFQPFQYLPLLADRWGCIDGEAIDRQAYVEQLCALRTWSNGWLGINLHGSHLSTFASYAAYLPSAREQCVHLRRRDLIAQAVSYEIAAQTGKWSSHFDAGTDASYNFDAIKKRLQAIEEQERMIGAYLERRDASCTTIWYEDLVEDPEAVLRGIFPNSLDAIPLAKTGLRQQASQLNRDWSERFAEKYRKKSGVS